MKKVIILGGAGFIGLNVAKYLIAKGKDDDTYVPLFLQLTHQVPHTPVDM